MEEEKIDEEDLTSGDKSGDKVVSAPGGPAGPAGLALAASRRVSFTMLPAEPPLAGGTSSALLAEDQSNGRRTSAQRLSATSLSSSVRRAIAGLRGSVRRRGSAVSSEDYYKTAEGARLRSEATDKSNRDENLKDLEAALVTTESDDAREQAMREIQGSDAIRQQIHSLFSIGARPLDVLPNASQQRDAPVGALVMQRREYADFHLSACHWLMHEGGEKLVQQDAWESCLFDWDNDAQGAASLGFEAFFVLTFEIAEMWLSSQDGAGLPEEDEYVIFIDWLTDAVTTLDATGRRLVYAHNWQATAPELAAGIGKM